MAVVEILRQDKRNRVVRKPRPGWIARLRGVKLPDAAIEEDLAAFRNDSVKMEQAQKLGDDIGGLKERIEAIDEDIEPLRQTKATERALATDALQRIAVARRTNANFFEPLSLQELTILVLADAWHPYREPMLDREGIDDHPVGLDKLMDTRSDLNKQLGEKEEELKKLKRSAIK